ncbi:MAG: VanZ family protein [Solirubrobacteraceae bacterium]
MRLIRAVDPWLWPPLVMAVIFVLSAQPDLSTGLGLADLVARKIAHAAVYALLCACWWRVAVALGVPLPRAVALALLLTIAYAISDEWHQSFVAGRSGSVGDVVIDAAGASAAALGRLKLGMRRGAPAAEPRTR